MAQVDDNAGVPTVAPDATPSVDRYQRINASPDQFGAQIGQGLEKAGAGASVAAKFFGSVAADDASNQYQDYATKLLHGDSSKQTPGPDGTMQPDTGYMGLRGDAALRARPDLEKSLDEKMKELRGNLSTPEQQLEFDNFSRRYRAGVAEKVGTHADQQATTWYQGVNTATSKLAIDHIANNADNPAEWQAGESDLIHSYVKNAQLAGATEGSPQIEEAVNNARRDALKARLDAVAVKDPSKAQAILDVPANKAIAGAYYDNFSSAYRGRAKQQQGYDVGNQYIKGTYTTNPAINPVVLTNAGAQYGISGSYLARVQQMETGGNPNQTSPTGAQGPFQFVSSTAKQYGLKDPFNYEQSADAAARLAADNKVTLTSALGRPPTDQELYLAHNQGSGGAANLLAHPNVRAGDLVGDRAIRVNGGDPNAPAVSFTSMITSKFNNAPVQATENRKAQAYQAIMSIPDDQIDPDVRQHALTHVTQAFSAQAIAEENDAKSKKAATDKIQSDFTSRIIKGDTNGIIGEIAGSGLPASEMQNLYKFAVGDGGVSDPLQYGPAYTQAMNRILAKPDDPTKLTDVAEVIRMGADGELTKRGVTEVLGTMDKLKKQPDQAGIATVKSSQLKYYQSKMAIDDEMSAVTGKPFKNQKGLDVYNHKFVPAFESAYSAWVAKGNDPMEFLNDGKKIDSIMDSVYPASQRAADAISAGGGGGKDLTSVPAPEGIDAKGWGKLMTSAPKGSDGKQWTQKDWSGAVNMLRESPTPETIAAFDAKFAPAGITAKDVLQQAPPKGGMPIMPSEAPKVPAPVAGQPQPPEVPRGVGELPSIASIIGGGVSHAAGATVNAIKPLFVDDGTLKKDKGPNPMETAGGGHKPKKVKSDEDKNGPLQTLVKNSAISPERMVEDQNRRVAEDREEKENPLKIRNPGLIGIRG